MAILHYIRLVNNIIFHQKYIYKFNIKDKRKKYLTRKEGKANMHAYSPFYPGFLVHVVYDVLCNDLHVSDEKQRT